MKRQFNTALAVSLAAAIQLGAADLYVSVGGSGVDCTSLLPCDFQTALDTARTNTEADTIHVASGTYTISSTLTYQPASGEDSNALTIQGAGADSTTLNGANSVRVMFIETSSLSDDSGADIIIKGMTFLGGSIENERGGGLKVSTGSADISVEDSTFSNNFADWSGGGVDARSVNGNVTLTSNNFNDNLSIFDGAGAHASSTYGNATLTSNIFSRNTSGSTGGGAIAFSFDGNATLVNNIFNGNYAWNGGGGAYIGSESASAILTNNTFSGNDAPQAQGGGAAVSLRGNSAKAEIYNNIIWDNTAIAATNAGNDLYVDSDFDHDGIVSTVILNSNNLGPDANYTTGQSVDLYITHTDEYDHGNNLKENPEFVDAASGDFHLSATSPLIDKGNLLDTPALPATDFEGDDRVIDGDGNGVALPDIGADEYQPDQPDIDVTPTSLDFGKVTVGNSKKDIVTVSNNGNGDLAVGSIGLSGDNVSEFSLIDDDDCANSTLSEGASCTVAVVFTPSSPSDETKSATLSIVSDDPDEATVDVPLTGYARSPEKQAREIIEFLEIAVAEKKIVGTGQGNSGKKRIDALVSKIKVVEKLLVEKAEKALIVDIYITQQLIENDDTVEICGQLQSVYQLTDGDITPPDFVENVDPDVDAVKELNDMIRDLMDSQGCP